MTDALETPIIDIPPRDTLAVVAHRDQRMIKFFEQIADAAPLIGTAWVVINDGNDIETGDPILILDLEA
jgi:hypothetical protein